MKFRLINPVAMQVICMEFVHLSLYINLNKNKNLNWKNSRKAFLRCK